jgi:hypothetical protein
LTRLDLNISLFREIMVIPAWIPRTECPIFRTLYGFSGPIEPFLRPILASHKKRPLKFDALVHYSGRILHVWLGHVSQVIGRRRGMWFSLIWGLPKYSFSKPVPEDALNNMLIAHVIPHHSYGEEDHRGARQPID